MGKLLFLLFTVVPVVELWLLVWLGGRVGAVPTVAMVVLAGVAGAVLAKREGRRVLTAWRRSMAEGRLPEEGLLSGALVLAGGVLLVTPGVLSDIVGFLLLVPPTRKVAAGWLRKRLEAGVRSGRVRVVGLGGPGAPWPGRAADAEGSSSRVGREWPTRRAPGGAPEDATVVEEPPDRLPR
ncbi:MAG: FxsA family protein [Myxococcaceae bacterium]|nr:FxsA family protein [Myxococcaceae bacterium]